jgi:hypothetical protein
MVDFPVLYRVYRYSPAFLHDLICGAIYWRLALVRLWSARTPARPRGVARQDSRLPIVAHTLTYAIAATSLTSAIPLLLLLAPSSSDASYSLSFCFAPVSGPASYLLLARSFSLTASAGRRIFRYTRLLHHFLFMSSFCGHLVTQNRRSKGRATSR